MRRFLNIGLILMLCILQLSLWLGEGSVGHYMALQRKISEQAAHNQALAERNEALAQEVYYLQNGDEAVENYARTQLGMIKQNETFYLVLNPKT